MTNKLNEQKTASSFPLRRLFIANRGEIARRIGLTARRLGMETIAITDRDVPPAYLAQIITHFVHVPEETTALYLNINTMIELARGAGADCVHPGFGFLSENSAFAQACLDAGLVWVGPHPGAIEAMASKSNARAFAMKSEVPCIEGLEGFDVTKNESAALAQLNDFAKRVGFPLLIKAAYGGGGKGMRIVHQTGELRDQALRAASEAQNSFGNPQLVVERYLDKPRHIEVQIMADKHGTVAAIGDRDCSLQRRHQKVIEEAPAPGLTEVTRKAVHTAAIRLAAAVKYDNAGTVEFLLDPTPPKSANEMQRFYFLEMNTRLQVEHPVTEEVFGVDLVEQQLRVAAGEHLPNAMTSLPARGHSLEARIYAEDVAQNYFPAPGPVVAFMPNSGPGVRWEIGMDSVDEITSRFDPMIAKLVVTAPTRLAAMDRMRDALEQSFLAVEKTNRDLLYWLVTEAEFRERPVSTHYLQDNIGDFLKYREQKAGEAAITCEEIFAAMKPHIGQAALNAEMPGSSGISAHSSTIASATKMAFSSVSLDGYGKIGASSQTEDHLKSKLVKWSAIATYRAASNATQSGPTAASMIGRGLFGSGAAAKLIPFWYAESLGLGGSRQRVEDISWLAVNGWHVQRKVQNAAAKRRERYGLGGGNDAAVGAGSDLVAPVPGKVVAIKIQMSGTKGTAVEVGQAVVILESMKMEFEVKAGVAGTISELLVKIGDQVTAGQRLAKWEEKKQD